MKRPAFHIALLSVLFCAAMAATPSRASEAHVASLASRTSLTALLRCTGHTPTPRDVAVEVSTLIAVDDPVDEGRVQLGAFTPVRHQAPLRFAAFCPLPPTTAHAAYQLYQLLCVLRN